MPKLVVFFVAASVAFHPARAVDDARAADAVAVFDDLCVSLFTGASKSDLDPTRFSFTKLADKTAQQIKPGLKGPLWDVSGKASDVHMLVHYEPSGLCVVEVAQADESSIRSAFAKLVEKTAVALASPPQPQPDQHKRLDGEDLTTSMWRMKSPKGDVMLAVSTYPDPKFMIQHLMTVNFVH
jgi:hypothetical protein